MAREDRSGEEVTLHDQGFGSRGALVMCRTRPMTRPSKMATPSVPGSLSGRVRRQMMLVAFLTVRRLAMGVRRRSRRRLPTQPASTAPAVSRDAVEAAKRQQSVTFRVTAHFQAVLNHRTVIMLPAAGPAVAIEILVDVSIGT